MDGLPELAYGMPVMGPGETVEVEEAKRLITTGFAVDLMLNRRQCCARMAMIRA